MAEKFVLLTEEDYNNYLKLKQHHENNNIYHKNYLKNMIQETKQPCKYIYIIFFIIGVFSPYSFFMG